MSINLDSLLHPFQRFGINLGLERIENLLLALDNPQHKVPIIHVAGTNGKGSVCAYLSSILTEAGYKVGRYTSPHLVDWTERICLNERPIPPHQLAEILVQIQQAINPARESPTQFEVITAAAWLYFAQSQVDLAVMEVGLGGRLDATNVCNHPLMAIITSISREHWQRLGPTLADIAREKAGILKKNCPAVIGQLPPEAKQVVENRLNELNCPTVWVEPAQELKEQPETWASYRDVQYPLSLLGKVQLLNSAIAIGAIQILQQQGWQISLDAIQTGMRKTRWQGRIQWVNWQNYRLLIDGAHNPHAAQCLRQYVDTKAQSVTWIMGMLSTKDHADIFQALLRPGDHLYLVPVPDHSSAEPQELAELATNLCPQLTEIKTYPDLFMALDRAIFNHHNQERLLVICGSLYLIGYFLANSR
jgi:dihydrofolate synthase/folylpolyglutamate synthase